MLLLAVGPKKRFPKRALSILKRTSLLRLSPASLLELQILREIGRIDVPAPKLIEVFSEAFSLSICDQPFTAVAQAAQGLSWTRDPFDRLIVAQAALSDSLLVSKDLAIREHYAKACWD